MVVTRESGTVAKWLNHKGIGFITPKGEESSEGKDILVHFSQLKQETSDGFKSLAAGSTVEYELETDPKNAEKKIAVNVTGTEGADCEPRRKGKGKAKKEKKDSDEEEEEDDEDEDKEDKPKKSKGKGKGKRSSKGKGKGKGKGKRSSKGKGKGKKEKKSEE